jgi:hypothetical protein
MSLETLTGKSLIGRQECAEGRRTFLAVNPAAGSAPLQPVFRESTPQEADRAFVLADAAFPVYRAQSAESRAAFLEAIAEELLAVGADLVQRAGEETGLPSARLEGERTRTVNQLRMFAGLLREGSWVDARIDRADPARTPIPKPDVRRRLVPIGPVVVFGASNFPARVLGRRRRHGLGARGRESGRRERAPGAPGHERDHGARHPASRGEARHAGRSLFAPPGRGERDRSVSREASGRARGRVHGVAARWSCAVRRGVEPPPSDSGLRRDGELKSGLPASGRHPGAGR